MASTNHRWIRWSRGFSRLALNVRLFAKAVRLFDVKAGSFVPAPERGDHPWGDRGAGAHHGPRYQWRPGDVAVLWLAISQISYLASSILGFTQSWFRVVKPIVVAQKVPQY